MASANKKQRHRAKREAKRRDTRRRESISPIRRLAETPGEVEYWMSENFQERCQCQIFVYKRAGGLTGFGGFLLDVGVVGLKDAWALVDLPYTELKRQLEAAEAQGIPMRPSPLDQCRRRVLAAARWAHDNGMRLPKDWTRTALLIGGADGWQSADVSEFRLEFAGHPLDLRQRLLGQPFEDYIRRTDITFEFSETATFKDQLTGDYIDPLYDAVDDDLSDADGPGLLSAMSEEMLAAEMQSLLLPAEALAQQTKEWLRKQNKTLPEKLPEAWQALMLAARMTNEFKEEFGDAPSLEANSIGPTIVDELAAKMNAEDVDDFHASVNQAMHHLLTDLQMMQKAMIEFGEPEEDRA